MHPQHGEIGHKLSAQPGVAVRALARAARSSCTRACASTLASTMVASRI